MPPKVAKEIMSSRDKVCLYLQNHFKYSSFINYAKRTSFSIYIKQYILRLYNTLYSKNFGSSKSNDIYIYVYVCIPFACFYCVFVFYFAFTELKKCFKNHFDNPCPQNKLHQYL